MQIEFFASNFAFTELLWQNPRKVAWCSCQLLREIFPHFLQVVHVSSVDSKLKLEPGAYFAGGTADRPGGHADGRLTEPLAVSSISGASRQEPVKLMDRSVGVDVGSGLAKVASIMEKIPPTEKGTNACFFFLERITNQYLSLSEEGRGLLSKEQRQQYSTAFYLLAGLQAPRQFSLEKIIETTLISAELYDFDGMPNYFVGKSLFMPAIGCLGRGDEDRANVLFASAKVYFEKSNQSCLQRTGKSNPGSLFFLEYLKLREMGLSQQKIKDGLDTFINTCGDDLDKPKLAYYMGKFLKTKELGNENAKLSGEYFQIAGNGVEKESYIKAKSFAELGLIAFANDNLVAAKVYLVDAINFGLTQSAAIWDRLYLCLDPKTKGATVIKGKSLLPQEIKQASAATSYPLVSMPAYCFSEATEKEMFFNSAELIDAECMGGTGAGELGVGVYKLTFQKGRERRILIMKAYPREPADTVLSEELIMGTRDAEELYLRELSRTKDKRGFQVAEVIRLDQTALTAIDKTLKTGYRNVRYKVPRKIEALKKKKPKQYETELYRHRKKWLSDLKRRNKLKHAKHMYVSSKGAAVDISPRIVVAREFFAGDAMRYEDVDPGVNVRKTIMLKHFRAEDFYPDLAMLAPVSWQTLGEQLAFELVFGNIDHLLAANLQNILVEKNGKGCGEKVKQIDNTVSMHELGLLQRGMMWRDDHIGGANARGQDEGMGDEDVQFFLSKTQLAMYKKDFLKDDDVYFRKYLSELYLKSPKDAWLFFMEKYVVADPSILTMTETAACVKFISENRHLVDDEDDLHDQALRKAQDVREQITVLMTGGFERGLRIIADSYDEEETFNPQGNMDYLTIFMAKLLKNRVKVLNETLSDSHAK